MREHLKTIVIAVLFLSLIGLTVINWFYWSDTGLSAPPETSGELRQEPVINVTRPISGDYERYQTYLTDFLPVANQSAAITYSVWNSALKDGGVHFEFLNAVPVWLLADGLASSASEVFDGVWVAEMILNENGLLIYDGEVYTSFSSPLPLTLPEPLEPYYASDSSIFPLAVVSDKFFDEPYRSELLEALGFNPNTNFYPKPDGEIVFVDDARTLHLSPDGRVMYHDGTAYTDEVTLDERAAIRLCLQALPKGTAFWGDGQPVFNAVAERDGGYDISLNYILNSAVFIESQTAFRVRDGVLRDAVIYLTPAALTDERATLIPRKRVDSLMPQGKKLCVGYRKSEGEIWIPEWYGY